MATATKKAPTPAPASERCGFCCRLVTMTVDDTGLCVRCDAIVYPGAAA